MEVLVLEEREVITFLVGIATLAFILYHRKNLNELPRYKLLLCSFIVLLIGWCLTIVEAFIWHQLLNHLEHFCYSLSSYLLAFWCWQVFTGSKRDAAEYHHHH